MTHAFARVATKNDHHVPSERSAMNRYLCTSLIVISPVSISLAQWSQFRGPNATGIAAETATIPVELSPDKALWKVALPAGHSSPAIWQDRIFLTGVLPDTRELEIIA